MTIVSTFKMWAVSPVDSYPVTDGTLHVKYEHSRIAYSQVKYKDFTLVTREDKTLLDIYKDAYIKIDELSTGNNGFGCNIIPNFSYDVNSIYDDAYSSSDDGYKNINSHIEEVKAKAIEAIPEAKEATNIVVEYEPEGVYWSVYGSVRTGTATNYVLSTDTIWSCYDQGAGIIAIYGIKY